MEIWIGLAIQQVVSEAVTDHPTTDHGVQDLQEIDLVSYSQLGHVSTAWGDLIHDA
jgi:hypothetical protein